MKRNCNNTVRDVKANLCSRAQEFLYRRKSSFSKSVYCVYIILRDTLNLVNINCVKFSFLF
jgi:hypothetical protein